MNVFIIVFIPVLKLEDLPGTWQVTHACAAVFLYAVQCVCNIQCPPHSAVPLTWLLSLKV